MPQIKALILSLLFCSFTLQVNTDELDQTIVGCEAVGCPLDDSEPHCTLANITFENIGLARIPELPDSLADWSIVKGVNISGDGANDFTSVYYLGTPEDVSLDEVHGCAVIFHDPPQNEFSPDGNGDHVCSGVIPQDCVDAIQDRAARVADEDADNLCAALREDLEDNSIDACKNLVGGGQSIGRISVTALSSLENIEGDRNATSDCWPILPKSANLAPLFTEVNELEGQLNASTAYPELNRITPLLTLFVARDGNESIVDETVSRLTCIQLNTTQTEGPEGGESAASLSAAVSSLLVGGALVVFMVTL